MMNNDHHTLRKIHILGHFTTSAHFTIIRRNQIYAKFQRKNENVENCFQENPIKCQLQFTSKMFTLCSFFQVTDVRLQSVKLM